MTTWFIFGMFLTGVTLVVGGTLGGRNLERASHVPPMALHYEPALTLDEFKRRNRQGAVGMFWVGAFLIVFASMMFLVRAVT